MLSTKLSKAFTATAISPIIGPEKPKADPPARRSRPTATATATASSTAPTPTTTTTCWPTRSRSSSSSNPCSGDSDGDGVEDGFEFQSALDLNNDDYQHLNYITPYPFKTPYPNPLYADANVDYDGDGLSLSEEYSLWKYTYEVNHTATRTLSPLSYTDGAQYSLSQLVGGNGVRQPTMTIAAYQPPQTFRAWANATGYGTVQLYSLDAGHTRSAFDLYDMDRDGVVTTVQTGGQWSAEATFWDLDDDGFVSDDERDEDGDGLNNYFELHGPASTGWWAACYPTEGTYPVKYAGTSAWDADSDGDGILDGADDQDFDDVPNVMELSRSMAARPVPVRLMWRRRHLRRDGLGPSYVNPFNPCLPDVRSARASATRSWAQAYAPFIDHWQPFILN